MRHRRVDLTPETQRQLERLSRSPAFLHQPAALIPQPTSAGFRRIESTWSRTFLFRSAEAAAAWNADWARVIDEPGARPPALVGSPGPEVGDPTLALVARIAAEVMREEVLAGTPAPEVEAGSRFELTITHVHEIPAFPPSPESLVLALTWAVIDVGGTTHWCVDSAREYELGRLPPGTAEFLTAKPRYETVEDVSRA